MIVSRASRPRFENPELQQADHAAAAGRQPHELALSWLREYLCLAIVIGGAVLFGEYREGWGLSWFWNVPVFVMAIILVGALQHRLAGLGHEASHYTFMKNRLLNDLIPDLFCMFPISDDWSTSTASSTWPTTSTPTTRSGTRTC